MPLKIITSITIASLMLGFSIGCGFFNAAPSECIQAAEDAGLLDHVIEQLRNSDSLNAVEQAALQRVLIQLGIDDVCEAGTQTMPGAARLDAQGRSTPDTVNPIRPADDSSGATENNRDDARARANTSSSQEGAHIPADEHRRRCNFWALNNLQPGLYA